MEANQRMKKPKILFFHNTIAAYRINFFRELSYISDLKVCLTDPELNNKIYHNDVECCDIDVTVVPRMTKLRAWLASLFQEHEYELVILPTLDNARDTLTANIICNETKKNHIPIGYFWEKWIPSRKDQPLPKYLKNTFQAVIAKTILKEADYIWYPGECTKKYFLSLGIAANKLFKIHDSSEIVKNKVIPSVFDSKELNEKIKVLYLGRIIKRKGLHILIQALSGIDQNKIALVVAGDGEDLEKNKQLAHEEGLNNVYFVGAVNTEDRYTYFSQTNIFVLPSIIERGTIEAWGLTLNEAMECNKYLISTDAVGSAYELIKNGENGQMVKQNSISEMQQALILGMKSYGSQIVTTTSRSLQTQYSYSNMAKDIINALTYRKQ